MANLTSFSSSFVDDDSSEDSCSICLESLNVHDPSTVTCCKHEYHLHCILEWSQRSKECPICWQSLALKDPASQELLAAVEAEKRLRSRNVNSSSFANSRLNDGHDGSYSEECDFDEQIMQHLVAAASRARFVHRQERRGSAGAGPSANSSVHVRREQPTPTTTSLSQGSSPTSGVPSNVNNQPPTPVVDEVARNTSPQTDVPFRARVIYSQTPPESARRLNTPEMFSFPESIKSKFSAASAKYKESISKGTRGLKEKLLARNASVKELSKGVQREMNAGIAGVARMIERLDLSSKRSAALFPDRTGETSGFPEEVKSVKEHSPSEDNEDVVHHVTSDAPSLISNMVPARVEIAPHVQSGQGALKT
uniref:RING-type E3 ubiquitin transferase n=1 Tax=Lotus japonicus TaxID=34305 RepID=I3STT9_LOTJA|nr:unknown [Lotus japonicus]